jgi:hypothetical protein
MYREFLRKNGTCFDVPKVHICYNLKKKTFESAHLEEERVAVTALDFLGGVWLLWGNLQMTTVRI